MNVLQLRERAPSLPDDSLLQNRDLMVGQGKIISDRLWALLIEDIVKSEPAGIGAAEKHMDQALGFMQLGALSLMPDSELEAYGLARRPDSGIYAPSPPVDKGWHRFVIRTEPYEEVCEELCGAFIHHEPADEGEDLSGVVADTVDALEFYRIFKLPEEWPLVGADCTTGHKGSGGDCIKPPPPPRFQTSTGLCSL